MSKELLINLRKATHVEHYWRCDLLNQECSQDPGWTYNGKPVTDEPMLGGGTMRTVYMAKQLADKWVECVDVHLPQGRAITIRNADAQKIWKAWKGIVYAK